MSHPGRSGVPALGARPNGPKASWVRRPARSGPWALSRAGLTAFTDRVSKGGHHARRWRSESGQEAIEYGGLLILIAAIVTALFSFGIAPMLQRSVMCALDQIFQIGPCAAAPAYPVSVATRHSPWDSPAVANRNMPGKLLSYQMGTRACVSLY